MHERYPVAPEINSISLGIKLARPDENFFRAHALYNRRGTTINFLYVQEFRSIFGAQRSAAHSRIDY